MVYVILECQLTPMGEKASQLEVLSSVKRGQIPFYN
jgi:hypothetical protein